MFIGPHCTGPPEQHLVVASEACTVCKRVVYILLECFLVNKVVLPCPLLTIDFIIESMEQIRDPFVV